MTRAEREQRNAKIIRAYVWFMRTRVPSHRKAVFNLSGGFDVSESTFHAVVRKAQATCQHRWFQPYKPLLSDKVCELCWTEK